MLKFCNSTLQCSHHKEISQYIYIYIYMRNFGWCDDGNELFLWYGWPTKGCSLISSRNHCQRSSSSRMSDTLRAGFGSAQNLSSSLIKWSCTTTPSRQVFNMFLILYFKTKRELFQKFWFVIFKKQKLPPEVFCKKRCS